MEIRGMIQRHLAVTLRAAAARYPVVSVTSGQADAPAALVYGGDESFLRQGPAVVSWEHWG